MSGGYTFGENNSNFVYDNRLDQLISILERVVSVEQQILEEMKALRSDLEDVKWRIKDDNGY